jgi:hypothetical protein
MAAHSSVDDWHPIMPASPRCQSGSGDTLTPDETHQLALVPELTVAADSLPVESEQARTPRPVTASPPEPGAPAGPGRSPVAAPRPQHDEHELPDGRYLLAYRSAPNA